MSFNFRHASYVTSDFLIRRDPGLNKLLAGLRGVVSVGFTYFVLFHLRYLLSFSSSIIFLGSFIAMIASLFVSDSSIREQKRTLLWILPVSCLSLTAGIILSQQPFLRILCLIVIAFLAVYARRFGSRGLSVGMLSFMAYFCSLLFPIEPSSLTWALSGIGISLLVTFSVRFLLLKDRPHIQASLAIRSFKAHVRTVMQHLADLLRKSGPGDDLLSQLRPDIRLINQIAYAVESLLQSEDLKISPLEIDHLRGELFELELSLRKMIEATWTLSNSKNFSAEMRTRLAMDLNRFLSEIEKKNLGNSGIRFLSLREIGPSSVHFEKVLKELEASCRQLVQSWILLDLDWPRSLNLNQKRTTVRPLTGPLTPGKLRPTTVTAIQATIATSLATLVGLQVSDERWYWASVASFLVLTGAARSETVTRAAVRLLGTIAGLFFGFAFAFLIADHKAFEVAVIFSCIFFGIYSMRSAYGFWTAMWVTILLALFYDLMDLLTLQILVLRLEETLIGVFCAAIVSFFILPTSARQTVRVSLAQLLQTAAEIFRDLDQVSKNPFSRRQLIRQIRKLDQDLYFLRLSAGPLERRFVFSRTSEVPSLVHDGSLLTHYIRKITTSIPANLSQEVQNQLQIFAQQCELISQELNKKASEPQKNSLALNKTLISGSEETDLYLSFQQVRHLLESFKQRLTPENPNP